MSKELADLRSKLSPIVFEMSADGASSREIVRAFRRAHADLIASASTHLIDYALVREVGMLRKSKAPSEYEPIGDLFSQIGIAPILPVPGKDSNGRSVSINRTTTDLTRSEVIAYLRAHDRAKAELENDATKLRVLFKKAEPFMTSDEVTLRQALEQAAAAEEKDRGEGR